MRRNVGLLVFPTNSGLSERFTRAAIGLRGPRGSDERHD